MTKETMEGPILALKKLWSWDVVVQQWIMGMGGSLVNLMERGSSTYPVIVRYIHWMSICMESEVIDAQKVLKVASREMEDIKRDGKPVKHYNPETGDLFIYDPALGELARELREGIRGSMPAKDALNVINKAISNCLRSIGIRVASKTI